jgi:hypothetical protein
VTAVNFLHLKNPGPLPEAEIKRFWDLETIGITAHQGKGWDAKDSAVLKAFHDSYRTDDRRRMVSLPTKVNVTLPTNRQNAENRLK